jgi:hypothetical protein
MAGAVTGAASVSDEPHRLQKRDCGSVKVLLHCRQMRTGTLAGSRAPHRLQNTDALSRAGVPQLLHFLLMNITSGIEFAPDG